MEPNLTETGKISPLTTDLTRHANPSACLAAPNARVLYGLPCANCRTYYAACLTVCPTCNSRQRLISDRLKKQVAQLASLETNSKDADSASLLAVRKETAHS